MIVTAIVFGCGAIGAALAPGTGWLITARVVAGAAIGIASFVAPLYISEIAPVAIRGKLVSINQVALTSGIVISYLIDYAFAGSEAWRWMFAMAVIPAAAFGIGLMFIPDSPRWLAAHGRADQARAVLKRIRKPEKVERELSEIQQSAAQQKGRWSELLSPVLRAAMIVGIGLAIAQQITGVNTVIYYAPTIFKFAGLSSASVAILASVGVGTRQCRIDRGGHATDRPGRAASAFVDQSGGNGCEFVRVGAGIFVAAIVRQPGMDRGGEPHGLRRFVCRGTRTGFLAGAFGDLPVAHPRTGYERRDGRQLERNLLVAVSFLTLTHLLGKAGTFWLYGAVSIGAWFFAFFLVPETKGKTLEQIEAHWHAGKRPRELSKYGKRGALSFRIRTEMPSP